MMDQMSNLILTVLFAMIACWLFYGVYRTRNLIYRDRLWNPSRILFAVAGVLCCLTAVAFSTWMDWVRLAMMILCAVGFLLLRDGISEEGIAVMGRITKFSDIQAYDYGDYKKDFRIYAVTDRESNEMTVLTMPPDQKEEIIAFLKNKIGKKYTRMKKG
ncbi:MAG: hypothetical protein IKS32_05950 [Solobacterium sp.]|nr:hypothetical protein [Solobacterium sp.]